MRTGVTFISLSLSRFLHPGSTSSLGWAGKASTKDTFAYEDLAIVGHSLFLYTHMHLELSKINYTDRYPRQCHLVLT